MKIKKNTFDVEEAMDRVLFIAEIGLNHNGNFGLLYELIKQASYSGADIAKFQLGWRANEGEINQINEDIIKHIIMCCNRFEILPMFSIFNKTALKLANKFSMPCYKIASRTLSDEFSLSKEIVEMNKPVFISLGMWGEEKMPFPKSPKIFYLWCKSSYPAYPWELTNFPKIFSNKNYIGYSDHSVGIDVPLLAIARGAKVIEKHFTLDKSDITIRDHALSATPDEFSTMVKIGRQIKLNLNLNV
jgi:N,N'-diacetyllegionaminate synthase|tara:strand:- start:1840 stop:2574 length:735 start_codon:yes stop_codon:yes gene_type:complete